MSQHFLVSLNLLSQSFFVLLTGLIAVGAHQVGMLRLDGRDHPHQVLGILQRVRIQDEHLVCLGYHPDVLEILGIEIFVLSWSVYDLDFILLVNDGWFESCLAHPSIKIQVKRAVQQARFA